MPYISERLSLTHPLHQAIWGSITAPLVPLLVSPPAYPLHPCASMLSYPLQHWLLANLTLFNSPSPLTFKHFCVPHVVTKLWLPAGNALPRFSSVRFLDPLHTILPTPIASHLLALAAGLSG